MDFRAERTGSRFHWTDYLGKMATELWETLYTQAPLVYTAMYKGPDDSTPTWLQRAAPKLLRGGKADQCDWGATHLPSTGSCTDRAHQEGGGPRGSPPAISKQPWSPVSHTGQRCPSGTSTLSAGQIIIQLATTLTGSTYLVRVRLPAVLTTEN